MNPLSPTASKICLTPTRNETWIIKHFVEAARLWANHVIVADQGSDDGTLEYLRNTPSVTTLINDSPTYNEAYRQRLLLHQARTVNGKRILIGLDADEAFSANSISSSDWEKIEGAAPGTILRFRWVNILPGFQKAWIPPNPSPFGFVDDGSEHNGSIIHSPRVPQPKGAPVLDLEDIVVLHFQYVLWDRMVSKHRWYQAWEHFTHPEKGALQIFRGYNHMYGSWDPSEIHPIKPEWFENFTSQGINFNDLKAQPFTWWDQQIVNMLIEKGPDYFRKTDIWDQDWNGIAQKMGVRTTDLSDPRNPREKIIHKLLKATQKRRGNWGVRILEKILRSTGW